MASYHGIFTCARTAKSPHPPCTARAQTGAHRTFTETRYNCAWIGAQSRCKSPALLVHGSIAIHARCSATRASRGALRWSQKSVGWHPRCQLWAVLRLPMAQTISMRQRHSPAALARPIHTRQPIRVVAILPACVQTRYICRPSPRGHENAGAHDDLRVELCEAHRATWFLSGLRAAMYLCHGCGVCAMRIPHALGVEVLSTSGVTVQIQFCTNISVLTKEIYFAAWVL